MNASVARTLVALALQGGALVALAAALFGGLWPGEGGAPRLLVLVDRSQSMPRALTDQALAELVPAARSAGAGALQQIEFAGRPGAAGAPTEETALEPSATNIEAALEAALAIHAQAGLTGVAVISDGHESAGDAARGLRALRQAGLPVHWLAVGSPPPPVHIAEVLAPGRARVGQRIPISVQLAGQLQRPLRIRASARSHGGESQSASSEVLFDGKAMVEFDAGRSGALLVDVVLEDVSTGRPIDTLVQAAVVDVEPRAAILYAQGSTGTLARSLKLGGWAVDVIPAGRLDAHADGLAGLRAVILEDVAIADAGPRFWSALASAVKDGGLGLLVLGGERSFARGGYRHSVLESVLPVLSEPAALDQPAAIVFAVDKSGSMGQGSGGVDRFQLAQRAVQETARGLGERDALGLVVFDVAPRVLVPLGPAAAGTRALELDWRTSPNGGTRLAPAFDAAIGELERSAAARRMLVLVTDGFVDSAPPAELRARLARSHIETIALAVGPDADVDALQHIVGETKGQVLRVNQAAELPSIMRSGLERRRSRVERGAIAVQQRQPLPFARDTWKDWPAVAAYLATRPQTGAVVAVQSQQGEPLVAFHTVGRGRVVAVTSGLGPWVPQWLRWAEWPRLAGGLADWISGTPPGGALAVKDLPQALRIEVDLPTGPGLTDPGGVSITVDTPQVKGQPLDLEVVAAGRWRGTLPDEGAGLYTFVVSTPGGAQRQLHLRPQRAETRRWGLNPALEAWRTAGLVGAWDPGSLARKRDVQRAPGPPDRALTTWALVLFVAGVAVDRASGLLAGVTPTLRRWRGWISKRLRSDASSPQE